MTATTLSGLAIGETWYYRIAATNAGGESMPSETLAVRRPAEGVARILIVNGFDRLRRQQNPAPVLPQPPAYAGDDPERPIWRQINSFDYVVQFAKAMDNLDVGFDSCLNDPFDAGQNVLYQYDIALWNLGTESAKDATLGGSERGAITSFLNGGGALFISGADLAYDLIDQGRAANYARNTFKIDFVANDVGTYGVEAAGGILGDVDPFDFDPGQGAPYIVYEPDELAVLTGGEAVLSYAGGGVAGVQYDAGDYRVVTFGFPFEAISSAAARSAVMERVIPWLEETAGPVPFDYNGNGVIDQLDMQVFEYCHLGPAGLYPPYSFCSPMDGDRDLDVDLADFKLLQEAYAHLQ